MFHVYSINSNTRPKVTLSSIEHSGYDWFTPDEAIKLDLVQDEEVPINDFFLS